MALKFCCRLTRFSVLVLENRKGFFAGTSVLKSLSSAGCLQYQRPVAVARQENSYSWRGLCTEAQSVTTVTYEELKKLLVSRSGVVIDVREPWELREYGNIPGSINVPLGQVKGALMLKPEEFKEQYGGNMPSTTENVVFSCLAGMRSIKALDTALSLGYSNAQHYPGGWKDWAKHEILHTKD